MKSRALHRLYINCTESSASRPWEGSQLSLMSKPSPAKERFGFFLQGSLLCSTSVSVTFPLSMCNPDYTDTEEDSYSSHVLFFLLSIGGSLPIVFAYFSEFLSREKRGEHLSWLCMFWMIGGIFASAMAWSIIPHYGKWFVLLTFDSTTFPHQPHHIPA